MLTVLGLDIASMLGNAFLVEAIFGWPGIAKYGVNVVLNKDLSAIVGVVLVMAGFFILINFVVDILVSFINPRTDTVGRDVFSRVIFGYRVSLSMGVIVLYIVTPIGVVLGLLASYMGVWIDSLIMRVTDVFLYFRNRYPVCGGNYFLR